MTDQATITTDACCAHCGLPVALPRRMRHASEIVTADAVASPRFCCLGCRMAFGLACVGHDGQGHTRPSTLLLRAGLGVFLTMNLMVFNWFFYSKHVFGTAGKAAADGSALITSLFAYLLMLLCTIIVALLGLPIAAHIFAERRARLDVSVLILIGVLAAYVISVVHTLRGSGPLYYDTAAMILLLVTLGAYLDSRAKRKAVEATNPLAATLPARASAQRDGAWIDIDASTLAVGETVRVGAGDALPVDGVVVDGRSEVSEGTLTGESQPRAVEVGDSVLAGSVCIDGALTVRAERVGADLAIARMRQLLEEARLRQPRIQRIADRVAAGFVPAVVLLAIGVGAWHGAHDGLDRGLLAALSVLLISCPCALGLAAPLATWRAMNHAAKHGILFDSGATLERAARVRQVLFDKTGTLTRAELAVDAVRTDESITPDEAITLAASLATTSRHPVGAALQDEARRRQLSLRSITEAHTLPGRGVEGVVDGVTFRLGNDRLIAGKVIGLEIAAPGSAEDDTTRVLLLRDSDVIACFELRESLRPEALAAVRRLRDDGIDVQVLTGDRAGPARRLSEQLGVRVHHGLLPADKVRHVQSARHTARSTSNARGGVAFVGDGLNDAPALASADVGIAVHGATDLARQAGHVMLMSDRIDQVPVALAIARDTMRRIRLNLLWSFSYNGIGLTLAALGLLNPIIAALAMVGSSLFVVATSMREGDDAEHDRRAATRQAGGAPAGNGARTHADDDAHPQAVASATGATA